MDADFPLPDELTRAEARARIGLSWWIAAAAFVLGLALTALPFSLHWFGLGAAPPPAVPSQSTQLKPAQAPPGTDLSALTVREQALGEQLDQLAVRLTAIETGARSAGAYATRGEALLVTMAARRVLERGQKLGYLESQLKLRFGESQPDAVAAILGVSRAPVTVEDLRAALDSIAPKLVAGNPDESWWTVFRRQLGDLVVLREDTVPSPRAADRLKRARRALELGQVEAALAEVAMMPGARNADSWMAAAQRYVAAQHALTTLEQSALTLAAPLVAPALAAPHGL